LNGPGSTSKALGLLIELARRIENGRARSPGERLPDQLITDTGPPRIEIIHRRLLETAILFNRALCRLSHRMASALATPSILTLRLVWQFARVFLGRRNQSGIGLLKSVVAGFLPGREDGARTAFKKTLRNTFAETRPGPAI